MLGGLGPVWIVCVMEIMSRDHWTSAARIPTEELDPEFWIQSAQRDLDAALNRPLYDRPAKNIILFVGDGLSLSTVTASRIYKGQKRGRPGEEEKLVFEKFPNIGLAKTYNVDHQVPDSAATATAFLCGVKAQYGTVGVGPRAARGNCPASKLYNLTCIAEMAQNAGLRTGFVTTSRVTHATPAPLYASSPDRNWEADSTLSNHGRRAGCKDIGAQLVQGVGQKLNVVLGGGRRSMLPITERDPEYPNKVGYRMDDRNLVDEWLSQKDPLRAKYVWKQQQFDAVDSTRTDHLLGLFEHSHMQFDGDRQNDTGGEPSLSDMVEKAIRILNSNSKGYFLLVEAARIDHAHHGNTAHIAIEETLALDNAVQRALDLVDLHNTMLIVTSDHSHPLTIGSYATRGNPITGLTDYASDTSRGPFSDVDLRPFTTLSYANGPGYASEHPRPDLSHIDTTSRFYRQVTSVPLQIVTHDGTDVPIYSTGAMSHLLHSTHEQHYIYHAMCYAACLGHYGNYKHCRSHVTEKVVMREVAFYNAVASPNVGNRLRVNLYAIVILFIVIMA